jgi:hypothetical protein
VLQLPVVPIDDTMLPDGRLLMWSRLEDAAVWDWTANVFRAVPAPSWLFCASQTFLANGEILVAGGHITDEHGIRDVYLFDPAKMTWTRSIPMRAGRWYPSIVNLPAGEVLVVGPRLQQPRGRGAYAGALGSSHGHLDGDGADEGGPATSRRPTRPISLPWR